MSIQQPTDPYAVEAAFLGHAGTVEPPGEPGEVDTSCDETDDFDGCSMELRIGDVYTGDSLGVLTPSEVAVEAHQDPDGWLVLAESNDDCDCRWIQMASADTVEIEQ
ncbi:hypothetical protein [Halalkalicoccus jeotgali]|uniref:Uncharacterized protein n=1 Tax=Halalkalicoccus jeotgali (strain DSM 18796 / CECT 7217 / JCM 14584 / KCTC 4019 / B3) TaxID=795797 RepID=D8J9N4_HALJB|nr:hypothetical protein [Halalkalicoccus jeotgali]ADJ14446.1 hypothetical protein HacjB3_05275 [Halalkalicoccus jeotgali B3]ELY40162.1 hypothetical protein C497_03660 [Halalkalicoccus jeotgali B3]